MVQQQLDLSMNSNSSFNSQLNLNVAQQQQHQQQQQQPLSFMPNPASILNSQSTTYQSYFGNQSALFKTQPQQQQLQPQQQQSYQKLPFPSTTQFDASSTTFNSYLENYSNFAAFNPNLTQSTLTSTPALPPAAHPLLPHQANNNSNNNNNQNFQNAYIPTTASSHQNLTTLSNVASLAAARNGTNLLRGLNTQENSHKNLKANKIANSDGDNSKIYGNAFLGPNLWDKNDLFQGDKFGVKFEYLEIDEFLNENGLNETDVEFLDQLQKPDAAPLNQINNNNNNGAQANTITTNLSANVQSKPAVSPSASSPSSSTSSSSTSSSPSSSNNPIDLAVKSSNNNSSINKISTSSKSNPMSIISQTHNYSTPPLNFKFQHQQSKESLNENLLSSSSSSANNFKSSMNDSSFDWNSNSNDVSIGSINDFDDFDPKSRKFSDEDLRPLPILRKSKKQFVPSEMKDDKYWARRKKNNIAAKRSRDARRVKENQIAIRASYLEKENDFLKKQLDDCKRETKLLKLKLAKYESTDLDHLSSK